MTDKYFIYEDDCVEDCWGFYFYAPGQELRNYLKLRFEVEHLCPDTFCNHGNVAYGLSSGSRDYESINKDCGVISYKLKDHVLEFVKMCGYKIIAVDGIIKMNHGEDEGWRELVMDQLKLLESEVVE